ncbi:MAG: hypothetical protein Q6L60_10255 [Thermostichus sp. HHBFW_bins_43]
MPPSSGASSSSARQSPPLSPWIRWGLVGSVVVAIGLGAFWQYGQPERQVRAHTETLLRAVEGRHWERVESLFSEAYADDWGFDKQTALSYGQQIFGQFFRLRIQPQELQVQISPDNSGRATVWFVIEGSGGPLANLTRDQVNALEQPFQFYWQRPGGNPYRWELMRIENPDLEIPELRP